MKKMLYFSTAAALLMATSSWADDSHTVTKAEFNALKRQVARLEKKLAQKHTKEKHKLHTHLLTNPVLKSYSLKTVITAPLFGKPKIAMIFLESS